MGDLLSENSLQPDPLIALALDLHRLSPLPTLTTLINLKPASMQPTGSPASLPETSDLVQYLL